MVSNGYASGIDEYMENMFAPEHRVLPQELSIYAAGKFTLEPSAYWRIYHYLGYRALTGHPLSQRDIELLNIKGGTVGNGPTDWDSVSNANKNGVAIWYEARRAVDGPDVKLDLDLEVVASGGEYMYFLNCHKGAFVKASQTLEQRYKDLGKKWGSVWLANQDAVFANCSSSDSDKNNRQKQDRPLILPSPLPSGAPDVLVKDWAYQKASALFYAGRYDKARAMYLDIAKDAKSPWQPLGKYIAARCLLRKASLSKSDGTSAEVISLLTTARKELLSLPGDQAKSLISWVDVRLRPEERREELSALLSEAAINDTTWQPLMDYLILLDRIEGPPMIRAKEPMTAWIGARQAGYDRAQVATSKEDVDLRKIALEVSRSNWKKTGGVQWLVAILTNVLPGEITEAERKASIGITESSPAYGQLQFHLARIALAEKKFDDVETIVNAMIARPLQPSIRNRWLRLKMASAKTVEDFFAAAPRTIVNDTRDAPIPNEEKATTAAAPVFDDDFAKHLSEQFSLADLLRYKSMMLDEKWISEMIWTRAVILGKYDIADTVTDDLMKGRETTHYLYDLYKKAATVEQKKSAALFILANTPELYPHVKVQEGSAYAGREYWSCEFAPAPVDNFGSIAPPFLSLDHVNEARQEIEQIRKIPKRSAYLVPQVIELAKKNKADPEIPKALHFLVGSAQHECDVGTVEKKGAQRNYSKEAFKFLHSQYPKNKWTLATKYYY